MTPQTMFWLSSIAGALLFLGAGFLLARMRAQGGTRSAAVPLGPPEELQQLRAELAATTRERDETREQLLQQKSQIAALEGAARPDQTEQIATLTRELEQARAAKQALEARAAEMQPVSGESSALKREVEQLREKLVELREERDSLHARTRQLQAEADTLRKSGAASGQTDRRRAITLEQKVVDLEHQLTQERQRGSELQQELEQQDATGKPAGTRPSQTRELQQLRQRADALQLQLEERRQRAQQLELAVEREKKLSGKLRQELGQATERDGKTVVDGGDRQRIIELEHRAAQQAEKLLQLKAQLKQASSAADLQSAQQLKREADRAIRAERQLREDAEKHAATVNGLRNRTEELLRQVAQMKDELEKSRLARAAAQRDAEAVEKEVRELKAQASQDGSMVMELESLRQRAAEAEKLREEKAEVARSLEEAREEITHLQGRASDAKDLATDHHDLKIKATVLGEQVKELEQLREDNARLKASAGAAEELQGKVGRLEAEIASLRAQGLVKKRPRPEPTAARRSDGLGGTLQTVVDELEKTERSRGAIVADRAGLVVAGGGEQAEPLAAAAAILSEVGERIQQLLTLGAADCLTYVDENGLVFATHPIAIPSEELLLATLSVGSPPGRELVDGLIARLG